METTIFSCVTGSHLYGTNHEKSDVDYVGVFVSSCEDFFGLKTPPDEIEKGIKKSEGKNTTGDIDFKLFSLKKFFKLAGSGQPAALEMLFVPENKIIEKTTVWDRVLSHRDIFLSRKCIIPFISFAKSQMYRAVVKGDSLRLIQKLLKDLEHVDNQSKLAAHFQNIDDNHVEVFGNSINMYRNEFGFPIAEIAGTKYDVNIKIKAFKNSLKAKEEKYGNRVRNAAEDYYDYKSLMHAMRQIGEAEEFIKTGKITLPRPIEEVNFLKSVLNKQWPTSDIDLELYFNEKLDYLGKLQEISHLPEEPNWERINSLCIEIQKEF